MIHAGNAIELDVFPQWQLEESIATALDQSAEVGRGLLAALRALRT